MTTPFLAPPDRTAMRLAHQARVLFADTDQMGVVYHASYLRYLEAARVELLRAAGMSVPAFEPLGLGLPLTEVAVRYRAFARYDDRMSVHCGISALSSVRSSRAKASSWAEFVPSWIGRRSCGSRTRSCATFGSSFPSGARP